MTDSTAAVPKQSDPFDSLSRPDNQALEETDSSSVARNWSYWPVKSNRLSRSAPCSPHERLKVGSSEPATLKAGGISDDLSAADDRSQSASSLMTCVTEISVYRSPNSSLTPPGSTRSISPDDDDVTSCNDAGSTDYRYFDQYVLSRTCPNVNQNNCEFPLLSTSINMDQYPDIGSISTNCSQPRSFFAKPWGIGANRKSRDRPTIPFDGISWINLPPSDDSTEVVPTHNTLHLLQPAIPTPMEYDSIRISSDSASFREISYLRAKIRELSSCNETLRAELRQQTSCLIDKDQNTNRT